MNDFSESILPLCIGLVVSLALTFTGLAWTEPALTAGPRLDREASDKMLTIDPVVEQRRRLELGDDVPKRATVAWLGAEAYQDLVAPKSTVDQAPSQEQVDPVEDAPMRVDATPPAPPVNDAPPRPKAPTPPESIATPELAPTAQPTPAPPVPSVSPLPALPEPAPQADALAAATPDLKPLRRDPVDAPNIDAQPAPDPTPDATPRPDPEPVEPTPTVDQPEPSPADTPAPPQPVTPPAAEPTEQAAPTASPDEDRESEAAQQRDDRPQQVQPGRVFVSRGIKIETAHPRFDAVTLSSALPTNPLVRIRFGTDGRVMRATIVESTGFQDVDGPLLASLYKWKATGEELTKRDEPFEIEMRVLFNAR